MAVAHRVGEPLEFDGYVDDFERNVSAMQFSLDGGATWTTYQTAGAVIDKGVNWHFVYRPERPGRYLLKVRAVDGDGTVSDIVAEYALIMWTNMALMRPTLSILLLLA